MTAPPRLQLAPDRIQVFSVDLQAARSRLPALCSILSSEELARTDRFHDPTIAAYFAAARGLLRELLAGYLEVHPREVIFDYNSYGKPHLKPHGCPLRFNLSHSGTRMIVAVAHSREVGVDLEQLRPERVERRILKRFFSPEQLVRFDLSALDARVRTFFRYWTRAEAYLKARGHGFSRLGDSKESDSTQRDQFVLSSLQDSDDLARWRLCDLDLGSDYAGALAVDGSQWSITMHCWPDQD